MEDNSNPFLNLVRENVENNFVQIKHIGGKVNIADLFTKEILFVYICVI